MKKFQLIAVCVALVALVETASAQVIIIGGNNNNIGGGFRPIVGPVTPGGTGWLPVNPNPTVIRTPQQIDSYNPWTGGFNTSNLKIKEGFYDIGREESRYNGTLRNVDRPIYDNFGNTIGRQTGQEWYNPITNRWHKDVNNQTLNNIGGINNERAVGSVAPQGQAPRR
jgi:hypothetical protein